MLRYIFRPRRITILLLIITFVLLCMNILCIHAAFMLDNPYPFSWKFYFDKRMNIPFFFSLGLLLSGTFLACRISASPFEVPSRLPFWKNLSALTAFIAVDKFFHLHNKARAITSNVTSVYEATSPFYFFWTIPYLLFFGYMGWGLQRSFKDVPAQTKRQLVAACALFVAGAIVLELVGVYYAYLRNGAADVYHMLIKTVEELLQILGTILLIHALATYRNKLGSVHSNSR